MQNTELKPRTIVSSARVNAELNMPGNFMKKDAALTSNQFSIPDTHREVLAKLAKNSERGPIQDSFTTVADLHSHAERYSFRVQRYTYDANEIPTQGGNFMLYASRLEDKKSTGVFSMRESYEIYVDPDKKTFSARRHSNEVANHEQAKAALKSAIDIYERAVAKK